MILHFAVIGRFHGDDEATTLVNQAASPADAIRLFKEELCTIQNLNSAEKAEALGDDPSEHMTIYVDTVLCSAAPIEELTS